MNITSALDEIVKQRQADCDHNYQDRVVSTHKTFCGKCGLEEK